MRGGGTWPFVGSLQLMTWAVPASIVGGGLSEMDGRKMQGRGAEGRLELWSFTWRRMFEAALVEYLQVSVRDEEMAQSKGTGARRIDQSVNSDVVGDT